EAVDQLERQLLRITGLVDADLAQHLTHDDLDVLVVDRHALAAVDPLDLLDQIALDGVATTRLEVFLRIDRPVGDRVTRADLLSVLDQELRVVGDLVLALDDVLAAQAELAADTDHQPLDGRLELLDDTVLLDPSDDLI